MPVTDERVRSAEFLKKLRRIELNTRKVINSTFVGEYKSTFKGTGMEFIDVREYLPGDDVRSIDWKVTARMDRPFVKKFVEERELTVILCVDASGSGYFGTRSQFKLEQAAQVAATIAFSAVTNNDKVGLLFFTDEVERYIPPRKGKQHVLRLIRDILLFQPRRRGTNPTAALEFVMHLLKQKAIVFLISDFLGPGCAPERVRIPLGIAARRHDVVAIHHRPRRDAAAARRPRGPRGHGDRRAGHDRHLEPGPPQALRKAHAGDAGEPRPAVHAAQHRLHRAPDGRGLHAATAQVLPAPRPAGALARCR